MRIIYCGTGEIGLASLRALLSTASHEILAVVTQPDRPAGRSLMLKASAIKEEALKHDIPVLQPQRLRDEVAQASLTVLRPDIMLVFAYGQILLQHVLDIPRFGCLNLHTSLLPKYRGASPISAAVSAGDQETGVTVMYMDAGLDTGDILMAATTPIEPFDTTGTLHDRLAEMAAPLCLSALELIAAGVAPRTPQDHSLATHTRKLGKSDGWLDWGLSSEMLERHVRAMSPWPGAFARVAGSASYLKIHRACLHGGVGEPGRVLATNSDGLVVAAGKGALLLQEVQAEGRKRMLATDYLRGGQVPTHFDLSFSVPL